MVHFQKLPYTFYLQISSEENTAILKYIFLLDININNPYYTL